MNKKKQIAIIIICVILIILSLAYFLGGNTKKPDTKLVSSSTGGQVVGDAVVINNDTDFLKTLDYLKSMKIDESIFINSSFKSLKDNTVDIEFDGNLGRTNPFSPIVGGGQNIFLEIGQNDSTVNNLEVKN